MKNKFIYLLSFISLSSVLLGQAVLDNIDVTVTVVDQDNEPVENAEVLVGFRYMVPVRKDVSKKGNTNEEGVVVLSGPNQDAGGCVVKKDGYYETYYRVIHSGRATEATKDLVLKKKINPISMYAKQIQLFAKRVPKLNEQIGYDMVAGDFVAPYGDGMRSDLLCFVAYDKKSTEDVEYHVSLEFNENDGAIAFEAPIEEGSKLRSKQNAPAQGYGEIVKYSQTLKPGVGVRENVSNDQCYYFRVRTVIDEDGEIISAHYGKMYGKLSKFTYYFNPTPNDRNVEFDPSRNLFNWKQLNKKKVIHP